MLKVLIYTITTIEVMETNQLIRFEGCQNYIRVHIENGTSIISNEKLIDVVSKMKSIFYQCHKSHVVNLDKVVRYHKTGHLELTNGDMIPVARRRKSVIEEDLKKWLEQKENYAMIDEEVLADK
jgi:two-component system LytT family response regulator